MNASAPLQVCAVALCAERRERWSAVLAWGVEAVLLTLICLSPWAFGAVHLYFEFWLDVGLALLLCLWALRILVLGSFSWQRCPVALCLAGLFFLAVAQLVPLAPGLHRLISPGSSALIDPLFPVRPEVLPGGVESTASALAPSTISADPGATRSGALRLLAVFLAFALVRNNGAFPGGLRRLAIVAVANGALLSLVALLQFFSSPPNQVYWTFPSQGTVFGPFLCRNHFPFYVNLCFGLGLGLLLSIEADRCRGLPEGEVRCRRSMLNLLHEPKVLWLSGALALMLGSIVLSLSRGGAVSLLAGGLGCLLLGARSWRRSLQLAALLLVLGLGLGIVWFGLARVEARFAVLWNDDTSSAARLSAWQRVLPVAGQFPWLGAGLGTFGMVEPLSRPPGEDPSRLWDHAHNEYLEALIEGGLARFVLSLVAVGLVFRLGIRSYRNYQRRPEAGLVLGALLGFTAVVLHSAVDFGLHVPAVALLATTVAAYLCMGSAVPVRDAGSSADTAGLEGARFRLGRVGSLVGAATLILLGVLMVHEVHREDQAERLRLKAARLDVQPGSAGWGRRIALLQDAVALTPENAALQVELGEAYFAMHKEASATLGHAQGAAEAAQLLVNLAPDASGVASAAAAAVRATAAVRMGFAGRERQALMATLVPALDHYLQARAACPLLALPHLRIAASRGEFVAADSCSNYLARAKQLRPADTEVWYIAGLEELQRGARAEAWHSWRHALRCSNRHLKDIVTRSAAWLSPAQLVADVLPEDAEQLAEAAVQVFPSPAETSSRRLFLDPALSLLQTPRDASSWRLKGRLHHLAGEPGEALAAYRAALSRDPRQTEWRYEYAELLYQQSRFDLARGELATVLDQEPNHARARLLNRKLPILP